MLFTSSIVGLVIVLIMDLFM
nr:hypothetical protein [Staphylococcus ureilyticus]